MKRRRWASALFGAGILACGTAGLVSLAAMKKPPAQAKSDGQERAIRVETIAATPSDETVTLSGFGEVRSLRSVQIAPEVSGTVIQTHPRLLAGEIVRAGETLFAIDARHYEAALDQAKARIAECESQLLRLAAEHENETERLALVQRTQELAQARFERTQKLHAGEIGNQTDMDEAERAMNEAIDAARSLER
jgi:hypothetical protein